MAKTSLVIVESPAKAKTIGKYLGPAYQVKACMGHLRDLPKSTLGVDIEDNFTPNYKPIKGKEDIIGDLKYCNDVKYLDIGHDDELTDISFIKYMPKLEIAMLSTDIITTSGVEDVGSSGNVDDGGWTSGSTNW